MVLGLEHRESNSAHESQTANGWNQAGGRKSLGCSPEDTVMPCCQAAWRRGKPFRARLHSSSCVVMPVSASAMSFSDKLELSWPSFTQSRKGSRASSTAQAWVNACSRAAKVGGEVESP